MQLLRWLIAVALASAGLIGCSESSAPPGGQDAPGGPWLEMRVDADTIQCCVVDTARIFYHDAAGSVSRILYSRTWASSDSTALWVTQDGRYTTANDVNRFTTADLIVSEMGLTARHTIVIRPRVVKLAINPAANMRAAGTHDSLTVTTTNSGAFTLPDSAIHWRSSNSAAVAVSPTGALRALAPGDAWVTASALGAVDSVAIRVVAPYRVVETPIDGTAYPIDFGDRGDILTYTGVWQFAPQAMRTLDACPTPQNVNSSGEVLCLQASRTFAIWSDGALRQVPGSPVFSAGCDGAGRLNGKDDIAFVGTSSSGGGGCIPASPRISIVSAGGALRSLPDPPQPPYGIQFFDDAGDVAARVGGGAYLWNNAAQSWDGFTQPPSNAGTRYEATVGVTAVNARGYMVGTISGQYQPTFGIVREPGSAQQPDLRGGIFGLNEANQIVGHLLDTDRGYLGSIGSVFRAPLETLVLDTAWSFGDPIAINGRGMILVRATRRADGSRLLVILAPATQ